MPKEIEKVEPGLYYDCPVTERGHFDVGKYTVRLRRSPARAELRFKCAACKEEHMMVLSGAAS